MAPGVRVWRIRCLAGNGQRIIFPKRYAKADFFGSSATLNFQTKVVSGTTARRGHAMSAWFSPSLTSPPAPRASCPPTGWPPSRFRRCQCVDDHSLAGRKSDPGITQELVREKVTTVVGSERISRRDARRRAHQPDQPGLQQRRCQPDHLGVRREPHIPDGAGPAGNAAGAPQAAARRYPPDRVPHLAADVVSVRSYRAPQTQLVGKPWSTSTRRGRASNGEPRVDVRGGRRRKEHLHFVCPIDETSLHVAPRASEYREHGRIRG